MFGFDEKFYRILIKQVKQNESLYDKGNPHYFQRPTRAKTWREISKKIGKPVDACQNRWKFLRHRFIKEFLKEQELADVGTPAPSTWMYYNDLLFFKEHYKPHRKKGDNLDELKEDEEDKASQSEILSNSPNIKKEKYSTVETLNAFETTQDFTVTGSGSSAAAIAAAAAAAAATDTTFESDEDKQFWKMMSVFLKDLPLSVKDDAREYIFSYVMQLRRQNYYQLQE